MRRGFLVLAAATLFLTGCHELWGSSSGASDYTATGTATYDPTLADEQAQTNVRAAIPAIEAWKADHGTYKGMTVARLRGDYDRAIANVRLVGPLTDDTYCVESSVESATWHKAGPAAIVESGFCAGATGMNAVPPPPPSYGDPQTDLRAAVPAIEAWYIDHGKYAGMTIARVRAQYDYGIPAGVHVVSATKEAYCIETTVGGDTWSYSGPRKGLRHGSCR